MKKGSTSGGFGTPKPLPGQAGHNVSESEVLEKEAKDMEARLQMLQDRMRQQQLEESTKAGGSKWKSSRTDKGSIKSYGKDVQDKHKRRSDAEGGGDPALRTVGATATARRLNRQSSSGNFQTKGVESWTISDVGDWLGHILMEQYAPVFAQNEISGPILLDVTLEDLDYMNISVLGHRKVILKGAEELRKNGKLVAGSSSSSSSLSASLNNLGTGGNRSQSSQSTSRLAVDDNTAQSKAPIQVTSESAKGTHWSQLEPISSNKVSHPHGSGFVNAADGDIDEEAERLAFQEAVNEWRRGNSKAADTSSSGASDKAKPVTDDSMWHNPFADLSQEQQSQSKRSSLLDDSDDEGEATTSSAASNNNAHQIGGGGLLSGGMLDEEKEHAEFAKAVEMWRSGKAASSSSSASTTHVGATRTLAEELAKQLEQEQEESAVRLSKQKQAAEQRLHQANLELERMRQAHRVKESKAEAKAEDDASDDESCLKPEEPPARYIYSKPPSSSAKRTPVVFTDDDDNDDGDEEGGQSPLSPLVSARGDVEEGAVGHIEVSLVESVLGTHCQSDSKENEEAENCYVVEYDSEDD